MPNTSDQPKQPTGQQAYALIASTYGVPLKAETFVRVLVDGRGYADDGACRLMEWILNWFRPSSDGTPRFRGRLSLPSAWLADEWNVPQKRLESWRRCVTRAGLATFHSARHECWVEVHWATVADAVKAVSERKSRLPQNGESRFRPPQNGESKILDPPKTGSLKRLDPPKTGTKPPLLPPLGSPPLGEEEGDALKTQAVALVDYGRSKGRECRGAWLSMAINAYASAIAEGREPDDVSHAYRAYVDAHVDASKSSPLGHWLTGIDLRGKTCDYGELSLDSLIARASVERERAAERRRVENGGVPANPRFMHSSDGWIVSVSGIIPATPYDAVPADATEAQARDAFPDWWQTQRSGV